MTRDRGLREPAPLPPGARVALLSPSGPLNGPHELERALSTVESFGWVPVPGAHALARSGYFAGDDAARAADLVRAIEDDDIHGIWCLRGGYGAARLLPVLDDVLRQTPSDLPPKPLIGFSDITALHALWQQHGWVSFHGPVARGQLSAFSREAFRTIVAQGREASWVVLEDVGEATYRLDRMLTQLLLSGALDGCVGLVLGHFTDCPDTTADVTRSIEAVVQEVADRLEVPALLGVPIGHIEEQWTLPFGAMATLDAEARTLHVHRHDRPFTGSPTPSAR